MHGRVTIPDNVIDSIFLKDMVASSEKVKTFNIIISLLFLFKKF
jgi:subtilisin-like proprotein convertase family protein